MNIMSILAKRERVPFNAVKPQQVLISNNVDGRIFLTHNPAYYSNLGIILEESENPPIIVVASHIMPATAITIDSIGGVDYVVAWFDTTQDEELDYRSCNEVFFGFSNENIFDYLPPIEGNDFAQVTEDVPGYELVASTVGVEKDDYKSFVRDKVFVVQKVALEEMTGDDNLYHLGWEYDDNGDMISVPDKIHIPADILPLETIEGVHNWSNIRIAKANLDVYGGIGGHIYAWTRRQGITNV